MKNVKKSKYNSKKVVVDGIEFDSKDESLYYLFLKGLLDEDEIKDFKLQPKFELIPKFVYLGKRRQAITYTPDFEVEHNSGEKVLIDIKGMSTQQGDMRRKLFEYFYPEKKLMWVSRSLKYSDTGWIDYDELKKKRREAKKKKGEMSK